MIKDINKIKVIAEIGQAHEGSLAIALSYVEAVAKAGADAVKFQMLKVPTKIVSEKKINILKISLDMITGKEQNLL